MPLSLSSSAFAPVAATLAVALLLLGAGAMLLARARARAQQEVALAFVQAQTEQVRARYAANIDPPLAPPPRTLRRRMVDLLRRADLEPTRRHLAGAGALALVCGAVGALAAGVAGLLLTLGLFAAVLATWIWQRTVRFQQRLREQLPGFLDGVVRLMRIGSAVPAAFQNALVSTPAPLRQVLARAVELQRAGKELDQAVAQIGRAYRFTDMTMLASVLRVANRYGGRADVVMERTAAYMRDRQQARRELAALSAETRLSAWILGLLPLVVGGLMFALNAGYLLEMWRDPAGKSLLMAAFGLEVVGSLLLFRLARAI